MSGPITNDQGNTPRKGDLVLGPISQILLGLLALSWSGERLVQAYAGQDITFFAWCGLIAGAALTLAGILAWVQHRKPR